MALWLVDPTKDKTTINQAAHPDCHKKGTERQVHSTYDRAAAARDMLWGWLAAAAATYL
jgi:hypothetical protein